MSSMLASDLNNPEFVGATNPDSALFVEFYWHEPVDKWESDAVGKIVRLKEMVKDEATGKMVPTGKNLRVPYVRIMRPGDNTSIVEVPVRDDHKARWPQLWMGWQMREGLLDGGADVPGWKIEDWPVLQDEQRRELKYLRFYTVELIAGASDAQVQRMGMGGIALREQARSALRDRMGSEVKASMEAKDKMISDLAARLDKLEGKAPAGNAGATLGLPKRG